MMVSHIQRFAQNLKNEREKMEGKKKEKFQYLQTFRSDSVTSHSSSHFFTFPYFSWILKENWKMSLHQ